MPLQNWVFVLNLTKFNHSRYLVNPVSPGRNTGVIPLNPSLTSKSIRVLILRLRNPIKIPHDFSRGKFNRRKQTQGFG